ARVKALAHDTRPQTPRGAKLGYFFQKVVMRVEEKRDPRREFVDFQACLACRFDISNRVGDGERDFLNGSGARLANVIPADRNRVPVGNFPSTEGKSIRN